MFTINREEKIKFSKAIYYNFNLVPVKKPWRDATGGFGKHVPLQGWIEIYDSEGFFGGTFCSMGIVQNILPLILNGEERTYEEWYQYLYWKMRNFGFQSGQVVDLGQLDMIMLEILSKRAGKPLHRFLGAKKDWAAAYKGGGSLLSDDEDLVADMTCYVDEGYTTIKFKVGSDWGRNMERDVRRMKLVREAVGPDIRIAVDANQVWNVDEALRFADLIRPYDPAWYEEPVHSHDMTAIEKLCDQAGMMIGFGESMRNYYVFETYAEKGVTHLMPLMGRMSRMEDLMKIRKLAREKGLRFSSGGTVWLNAVFGALYEEDEFLENHDPMTGPIGDYLSLKPEEKNGRIYLFDKPGMPVELDVRKLEKDHVLESVKYFYSDSFKSNFAVRAAY